MTTTATATTTATTATTAEANLTATGRSGTQRVRAAAISALLAIAAMLGLTLVTASPASAATTRSVTVCLASQPQRYYGYATSQWLSSNGWTNETTVSLQSGCGTVTMRHTGYYRLYLNSAIVGSCVTNYYRGWTGKFVQQDQPVSQRYNVSSIPYYGQSAYYC